jgi:phospholipid/cholesterol/gamma-HCH transport system permease protein
MVAETGTLETVTEAERLVLRPRGQWLVSAAAELDRRLRRLSLPEGRAVAIDLGEVAALDTTGALLLLRTRRDLAARGVSVEVENVSPDFAPLLHQVEEGLDAPPVRHAKPRHHTFKGFLATVGEAVADLLRQGRDLLGFFGLVCVVMLRLVRHPRRLRLVALISQMERVGVTAIPIVGLLSFLIGVVFAYQGADQLRRFGAEIYAINLVGIGILRELGALLTAIIVAGRSGSSFTAEIGTMKVNEEIDAMQTLGLDPVEVLVLPRMLALLIALPLLSFYANFMGLLGGALMCWAALDVTIPVFINQLYSSLFGWTFWLGVLKSPVFAAIIALIGCYEGLRVSRSAESVGRLTTMSVVESIFLVIVFDAAASIVFSFLQI